MHWGMKWQPAPVFLPGESQGQRSLVSFRLWGRTESDTTEATAAAAATSILALEILWTEEPGGLQSTGLQRVRQD